MSDFPFQILLIVPVLVLVVVFLSKRQKRMMAEGDKMYANFRLADVAQRTGLAIVEGDPNFNLMMAYANHSNKEFTDKGGLAGKLMGEGVKESRAIMRGAPNGRPTEFVYYHRSDIAPNWTGGTTTTHRFECRLSVQCARAFPPFQIVLRRPGAGMDPQQDEDWSLPAISFGDPMLDDKLVLTGADSRLGPMLAPLVQPLATMGFVQIRGANQAVTSLTTMMASSVSLYVLEQMQFVLEQMAAVLEGRTPVGMAQPAMYGQRDTQLHGS